MRDFVSFLVVVAVAFSLAGLGIYAVQSCTPADPGFVPGPDVEWTDSTDSLMGLEFVETDTLEYVLPWPHVLPPGSYILLGNDTIWRKVNGEWVEFVPKEKP